MAISERNGVRVGLRVRDVDGKDLGKVTRLHEWGFDIEKGFPILFRRDIVARYDEVRGIDGNVLVLARSASTLDVLARGGIPRSWRVPAPPGLPAAATPPEARAFFTALAASRPQAPPPREEPPPGPEEASEAASEAERETYRTRGQSVEPPAPHP